MRLALLTSFVASKKDPLAQVAEKIHKAFLDAGLGEPNIRFNFGDAPTAGFVSSVDRVLKRTKMQKVGDPFDPKTTQGPQVNEEQFNKILGYIESGKSCGAKLQTGGARHGKQGYFIEPTVFTDVKDEHKIAQE